MHISKQKLKKIIKEEYQKLLNEQADWEKRLEQQKKTAISGLRQEPKTEVPRYKYDSSTDKEYVDGYELWRTLANDVDMQGASSKAERHGIPSRGVMQLGYGGDPVKLIYDSGGDHGEIPFGSSLHKYLRKIYPDFFPPASGVGHYEQQIRHAGGGPSSFPPGKDPHNSWGSLDIFNIHMPAEESSVLDTDPGGTVLDTPENRRRLVNVLRHGAGFTKAAVHNAIAQWNPAVHPSFDEYVRNITSAAGMNWLETEHHDVEAAVEAEVAPLGFWHFCPDSDPYCNLK